MLILVLVEPADAAADDDAAAKGIFLGEIDAAVLDGFDGGDHAELGEAIQAARGFRVKVRLGVPLHFAAEMDFESTGVELLDRGDAAFAGEQPFPVRLGVRSQGADGSQPRNDDPARHFFSSSFMM